MEIHTRIHLRYYQMYPGMYFSASYFTSLSV